MSLRLRTGVGLLTLLAAVTTAVPVHPQSRSLPDAPGTWKPWKPFFAEGSARKSAAATPALVKAFETELIALNAILRRASGVATPVGFSVETWGNLGSYSVSASAPGQPSGVEMPLSGALTFGAFPIFEYVRGGKTIREDTGETALMSFTVNTVARGTIDSGHVDEWGSVDTDAYLQPLPQGEIAGIPRFGDGLVVARDPATLWTPLPLKGALNLTLEARKAVVAESQQSVDAFTEQLAEVRDPARRAARLKDAQQAAATLPDPQGFMKQIEESLRIEEATVLKELGPTGASTQTSAGGATRGDGGHRFAGEALPRRTRGAIVLRRERQLARDEVQGRARHGLPSTRAAELRLLQQVASPFDAAGGDHQADHALLQHRRQIQQRGEQPLSGRVSRQPRAGGDNGQGSAPRLGALVSAPTCDTGTRRRASDRRAGRDGP